MSASRRRLHSRAAAAVWLVGALGLAACQGPPVNVRAVWMDQRGDRIRVYDAGRLDEYAASPQPFPGDADPRVELGPTGRFVLAREGPQWPRRGRVWDLEQRRNFAVTLPEILPGSVDRVHFSAQGDALAWVESVCVAGDCSPPSLYLSPLAASLEGVEGDLQPLLSAGPVEANSHVLSAANAPRVFTLGGVELGAYAYPDAREDAYELEALGHAMTSNVAFPVRVEDCPFPNWCRANTVVEPDGDAIVFSTSNADCASNLVRWEVGDEPSCLDLPEEVADARLIAAIGRQRLVFVDELRLHLVDLAGGWTEALPILGQGDYFFRSSRDGSALIFGSFDGPVLRVGDRGVELMSNASTECQDPGAPIVSEGARWVAWRCGRAPDVQLGQDYASALVRVSEAKLERYPGVSAWPIGIDDQGDLLFFTTIGSGEDIPDNQPAFEEGYDTYDSGGFIEDTGGLEWGDGGDWGDADDGDIDDFLNPYPGGTIERLTPKPLTLYALSAEGVIRRISDLEPTPVPLKRIEDGVLRYMQAQ